MGEESDYEVILLFGGHLDDVIPRWPPNHHKKPIKLLTKCQKNNCKQILRGSRADSLDYNVLEGV